MTDIENKIRKLEREKKIADEKFAKELASIKLENEHEETLTTTQIKDIKQAHKLGFKPKEIAHRFDLPFDSVNHVCRNENARKNWLKNHGKPNPKHPYANGKRPDYVIGTEAWRRRIRRGHQGEISRTLSNEGQQIHDERKECPFCWENNKKYGQSTEECLRYLKDRLRENGQTWKNDNENKPFPEHQPKSKQPIQENTDLPEDVMVTVNSHPLTNEEFDEYDDKPDESASELLKLEDKPKELTEKEKNFVNFKTYYDDELTTKPSLTTRIKNVFTKTESADIAKLRRELERHEHQQYASAERAENIKHQIQSIEDKSQAKGKDND